MYFGCYVQELDYLLPNHPDAKWSPLYAQKNEIFLCEKSAHDEQ
jgi:hypothetical protein